MAKIGDTSPVPKQPDPNQEMKQCSKNFQRYFNDYKHAKTEKDRKLAEDRMENELSLMDLAAQGIRKKEARVQEEKLSSDYEVFRENPSKDNEAVIDHDLNTLNESLEH